MNSSFDGKRGSGESPIPDGVAQSMESRSVSRWDRFRQCGNALGALSLALSLTGCGGSDSGSGTKPVVTSPSSPVTPVPTPASASCSLSVRQDWALSVLQEWYLFPDLLDTGVRQSDFTDLDEYLDALTAPARAAGKDRSFTYLTSIEEEDAYYSSGSTAGFGILLAWDPYGALYLREAYETAPGYKAGMDRGTVIEAIGTSTSNLRNIRDMTYDELVAALSPSGPGDSRVFRFMTADHETKTATVVAADYEIEPLSPRYGARILPGREGPIGYINLRSFIMPAEEQLRTAIADFAAQGITNIIIDVRYNGGGLIRTAHLLSDLLNAENTGKIFASLELRASKAAQNETYYFSNPDGAIQAVKIAFIGSDYSASASELIMNAQIPYSGMNAALIGDNTYGKPVGQYAFDLEECDDRLRVITFRTVNADGDADYFSGMASVMPRTCRAYDDANFMLGDPGESSIQVASDWINGEYCGSITAGTQTTKSVRPRTLHAARPTIAQIETPGLF